MKSTRGGALEHGRVGYHQRAGEGIRLAESSSVASSRREERQGRRRNVGCGISPAERYGQGRWVDPQHI